MEIFRITETQDSRYTEEGDPRIIEQELFVPATPLAIFEMAWNASLSATIPYVEAVNINPFLNNAPSPFGSAIYQCTERADITLGSNPWVEEKGYFLIGLFIRSGHGQHVLDAEIAALREVFHGFRYGGLHIQQVDGPHDTDPEANGEWWVLTMTAPFTFQTTRSVAGPFQSSWRGVPQGFPVEPPANGKDFAP